MVSALCRLVRSFVDLSSFDDFPFRFAISVKWLKRLALQSTNYLFDNLISIFSNFQVCFCLAPVEKYWDANFKRVLTGL